MTRGPKRERGLNGRPASSCAKEPCKFWVKGDCAKPDCPFLHDLRQKGSRPEAGKGKGGGKGGGKGAPRDLRNEPFARLKLNGNLKPEEPPRFEGQLYDEPPPVLEGEIFHADSEEEMQHMVLQYFTAQYEEAFRHLGERPMMAIADYYAERHTAQYMQKVQYPHGKHPDRPARGEGPPMEPSHGNEPMDRRRDDILRREEELEMRRQAIIREETAIRNGAGFDPVAADKIAQLTDLVDAQERIIRGFIDQPSGPVDYDGLLDRYDFVNPGPGPDTKRRRY